MSSSLPSSGNKLVLADQLNLGYREIIYILYLAEFQSELVSDSHLTKPPMYDLNDHTATSQTVQMYSEFKSQRPHNQEVNPPVHSSHTTSELFNRGLLFKEFNTDLASEVNVILQCIAFHLYQCFAVVPQ